MAFVGGLYSIIGSCSAQARRACEVALQKQCPHVCVADGRAFRRGRRSRMVRMCSGEERGKKEEGEDGEEVVEAPSEIPDGDWRNFRAKLIAQERAKGEEPASLPNRWAHEVPTVELGCILVASPRHFHDDQQYFAQTVVFITHHGEDGSCGVILNRPLTDQMSKVEFASGATNEGKELADVFETSALYLGGPVGVNQLILLHNCSDIEGSFEVVSGIFAGGLPDAIKRVRNGTLDPTRCRFFCGYSGWTKKQLEDEIKQGIWFVAATSNDVVTNQCIQLPRPLWRQVLDLMGGKYAAISKKLDELDGGAFKTNS